MSGHANLTCQEHVLFENAAARQARLRTNNVVFAHHGGMAYLHQAVDLSASLHASLSDGGAIDSGERLHLHVVLDDGDARLHDLVVCSIGALGETEAVAPMTAPFCRMTRLPMRQNSRTTACEWARKSSPICAPS
jgi:hypothetical protein